MDKAMTFIAEIGMNHNGNFSLAYELIKQAKQAGADIAKFQLGWRYKPGEINAIEHQTIQDFLRWGEFFDIEIMFSIINREAFEMVKEYDFKRFKIASRTILDDIDLARMIIECGKPVFVSLGMWDKDTLPFSGYDNITYLWCKSKYPTSPWDLVDLPKTFIGTKYSGYSDHSIGIETALLCVARGASVIEKHFTLDKSDTTIRDHSLSATPNEFRSMVNIGRDIHNKLMLGV